jgi:hypothetical protein
MLPIALLSKKNLTSRLANAAGQISNPENGEIATLLILPAN